MSNNSLNVHILLALWALQGKHEGDGYGFPFDRPLLIFAERIIEIDRLLPGLINRFGDGNKLFCKFAKLVALIANDLELQQKVGELKWRSIIFDQLRDVMRIAPVDGGNGLNDDVTAEAMTSICQSVEKFRQGLDDDSRLMRIGFAVRWQHKLINTEISSSHIPS